MTASLRLASAGRASIANYTGVVYAFLWGIFVFHSDFSPLSFVGTFFIAISAGISIYKAWFLGKKKDEKNTEKKPSDEEKVGLTHKDKGAEEGEGEAEGVELEHMAAAATKSGSTDSEAHPDDAGGDDSEAGAVPDAKKSGSVL